jgi:hypothetical protein
MADTQTLPPKNRASRRAEASEDKAAAKRDANPRGVFTFDVAGQKRRAMLRLDTLADIEDAFEVANSQELMKKLDAGGTRELGQLVSILVNAAEGEGATTPDECRRWPITLPDAFAIYFGCMRAAGGETDAEANAAGK